MSEEYRLEVEVSADKALQTIGKLNTQIGKLNSGGMSTSREIYGLGQALNTVSRGFGTFNGQASSAANNILRMNTSANNLNDSIAILTKSVLSYEIASRAIGAADEYNNIQNRLRLVTSTQQELNTAMSDTFKISQTTGTVWTSNVQIYQRYMASAKELNKTQAEIARITETTSKAIAMSGSTVESANAAIIQFSQGIASGVLRGQEFNSVAEQAPALMDAIGRGLNKTRTELRAMAADGKLTSDVVLTALENAEVSTDKLFATMKLGVSATFNRLKNATTEWIGQLNEASGATAALNAIMNMLAQNLDGAAFIAGTAAIAYMTRAIYANITAIAAKNAQDAAARAATIASLQAVAASTAATVAETEAKLAAAAAGVAEAQQRVKSATSATAEAAAKAVLTQREATLTAATAANTAATAANTAATNALASATSRLNMLRTAAMGLVGGPAGLIALGIGAASMYMLLKKDTDASAEAMQLQAKYTDMSTESLARLNNMQKEVAGNGLKSALETQNQELDKSASKFNAVVIDIFNSMQKLGSTKSLDEMRIVMNKVLTGAISYEEAMQEINKIDLVSAEQKAQLVTASDNYKTIWTRALDAVDSLKKLGIEGKITGNSMQNAALMQDKLNEALDETKTSAERASAALLKMRQTQIDSIKENAYIIRRSKDVPLDQAKAEAEVYVKTGKPLGKEDLALVKQTLDYKNKIKALDQAERDAKKADKKEASDAAKEQRRLEKEQEREYKERRKDYNQLVDESKTDVDKLNKEFSKFMDLWTEFGNGDQAVLSRVKSQIEEKMAQAEVALNQYKNQWASYFYTDTDKLQDYYNEQHLLITNSSKLNKEEKEQALKDNEEARKNDLANVVNNEMQKRLEAQKTFLTQKEYLEKKLALDLQAIENDPSLTDDQKNTRKDIIGSQFNNDINTYNQNSLNNYIDVMNTGGSEQTRLQEQLDQQRAIVQQAYDDQVIDKETQNMALAELDRKYWQTTHAMWTQQWSSSIDGWASFFSQVSGENSSAYRVMFAMQKSFAIATAALNIQKAISDGWASGATVYDKMAAVATIVGSTGEIAMNLASISLGFKDGGYTGNIGVNNIAGVVHGNEYVMPASQTSKYRSDLDAMRNNTYESGVGGVQVYITNTFNIGVDGAISTTSDTKSDSLLLGAAMTVAIKAEIEKQTEQGGIISNYLKSQRGR
jgi:tape measure domain-containing protein